jgi:hypothetical protein
MLSIDRHLGINHKTLEKNVQILLNLAKVKVKISNQNMHTISMYSKTCLLQTSMGPAFVFGLYLLVKLTNVSYFGLQLWCLMPLDLQLLVQSVPITTKVVSSNPIDGEVCTRYNIM